MKTSHQPVLKYSTYSTCFISLSFLLLFSHPLFSQTVSIATVNAGGGSYETGVTHIEWSIGESSAIETFTGATAIILSNGVLQPVNNTTVSAIVSLSWISGEISLFPVPVTDILHVNFLSGANGNIKMDLMNNEGKILSAQEFYYNGISSTKNWDLSQYASGVYRLRVILMNTTGQLIKNSAFSIIKIN